MKMNCFKLDYNKFDWTKPLEWNVWIQYDIDLYKLKTKLKVTDFYMPNHIQDELIDVLLAKHPTFKKYKKDFARKQIGMLILAAFPSGVQDNMLDQSLNFIKYKLRGL